MRSDSPSSEGALLLLSTNLEYVPVQCQSLPTPSTRTCRHTETLSWLRSSRDWTPLHHLEELSAQRTAELLRGGASVHAGLPSPLERARRVESEASALVRLAVEPWSIVTHRFFPPHARARAVELLRLGYLLAWSPPLRMRQAAALVDAWRAHVLPHAVQRDEDMAIKHEPAMVRRWDPFAGRFKDIYTGGFALDAFEPIE